MSNANFSARAADLNAAQTMAGNKTFSNNVTVGGSTTITGGVIELGSTTTVQTPFIDFHSTASANDYDARIIATGGINGTTGAGALNYIATTGHTFTGTVQAQASNVKLYGTTVLSPYLYFCANNGSYNPFIRSNASSSSMEIVNSANTAVNVAISEGGVVTARQGLSCGNAVNANKIIVSYFGPGYGAAIVCNAYVDGATAMLTTSTGGSTAGSVVISGTTTAYNTSSDYRIKSNYAPITGARDTLNAIKFYNGNIEERTDKIDYVIAHELQEVLPFAVHGTKDAMGDWYPVFREGFDPATEEVTPDDVVEIKQERDLQAVDYSKLVPRIGTAVQEQDAIIVQLQAQVADLLDRIAKLEAK